MFAVIKAGGHQYRVKKGDFLTVEKCEGKEGDKIVFDQVLCLSKGDEMNVGSPLVEKAKVHGVIKQQKKDPKILVFKYKRRKNYKRTRGHKQFKTVVEITNIKA
jgi:large subunit ribosomal protein L21